MYILTISLAPESVEDDPCLLSTVIEDVSEETVKEFISNNYGIDQRSFYYREYEYELPGGYFETVDYSSDPEIRLSWVFEIFEVKMQVVL